MGELNIDKAAIKAGNLSSIRTTAPKDEIKDVTTTQTIVQNI